MDAEALSKLEITSLRLQERALALSDGGDRDTAMLMAALSITMDVVREIAETVNRIDGLRGLGAAGD